MEGAITPDCASSASTSRRSMRPSCAACQARESGYVEHRRATTHARITCITRQLTSATDLNRFCTLVTRVAGALASPTAILTDYTGSSSDIISVSIT